jgi:small subunit ribosomal protein S7
MPRRASAGSRPIESDPVYGSRLVQQIVNRIMVDGKKSLAERIVYDALDIVSKRTGEEPVPALEESVKNLTPVLEVRSRRVGGATYQVPVEVKPRRANTLAIRWITNYSRQRREKTMAERLAGELMDAANGLGASVKRKEDMHKMAESNKAFAHYRW